MFNGIMFIYDVCMVICCLQTVCGVTEKHGYSLAGYHKLYQLCTDCLERCGKCVQWWW